MATVSRAISTVAVVDGIKGKDKGDKRGKHTQLIFLEKSCEEMPNLENENTPNMEGEWMEMQR